MHLASSSPFPTGGKVWVDDLSVVCGHETSKEPCPALYIASVVGNVTTTDSVKLDHQWHWVQRITPHTQITDSSSESDRAGSTALRVLLRAAARGLAQAQALPAVHHHGHTRTIVVATPLRR